MCLFIRSDITLVMFSDHNAVFCTHKKIKSQPINEHCSIKYRCTKQYSAEVFNQRLSERDWSDVLQCNVNKAWDLFKQRFIRETRIKRRSACWMSSEIVDLIRQRNRCFTKFKKSKLPADCNSYANLQNQTILKIQQAKSEFYSDSIAANVKQPKKLWKILNEMGSTAKSKSNSGKAGLIIDDEMCFDKCQIACHFNHYFTTVAASLVSKLPGAFDKYGKSFVNSFYRSKNVSANAFTIRPVLEEKVKASLSSLSVNKATGLDLIPSRFLRDSGGVTSSILTYIINLSIRQGVFPNDMKNARVVPLFKKNNRADVGNYRPVSILSTISKIFERLVYEHVEEYLIRHELLYEQQSGFRAAYSTDTCLIHLFDYVRQNLDLGNYVGMLLIDLQKAFDTVNHNILISKLQCMGFSNSSLLWFTSYLTDRTQVCDVEGTLSAPLIITCGVPQGSILGPLLFLIYINDMSAAVRCKLLLYADDSALLVPGCKVKDIENTLSIELESVDQWVVDNKLSMHLGKTEANRI